MLRPTSEGLRYAGLYASFPPQVGRPPSHVAEMSEPDASSHTVGAAVALAPKPVPLIVTVAFWDHCPELLTMVGCAKAAVENKISAQANAARPLVETSCIGRARAKALPPQVHAFRPLVRAVGLPEDGSPPSG